MIGVGDAWIAVSLLFGLFTRLGGVVCVLRAVTNILVGGGAGADTIGFNYLLIVFGLLFMFTAAGRVYGIDGWLIRRAPQSRLLRTLG